MKARNLHICYRFGNGHDIASCVPWSDLVRSGDTINRPENSTIAFASFEVLSR